MSGIYIPGMEMPTTCRDCRLSTFTDFDSMPFCNITMDDICLNDWETKRCDNCPLVPVPDHGRLTDTDVMCKECRRVAEEYDGIYPDCTYCPVHLAPTIIPADKEDK